MTDSQSAAATANHVMTGSQSAAAASTGGHEFLAKRHAKFFLRILQVLPSSSASFDTTRTTIAFFALSGLDLLNRLDLLGDDDGEKAEYVEWIYRLQVPVDSGSDDARAAQAGFRGSQALQCGPAFEPPAHEQDAGHLAMTYTAIASLLLLGDDLRRVNRAAILRGLRKLQLPDGSFLSTAHGGENDMRFVYCACTISSMLNDWSGIDIDSASAFILSALSYEGGFGQGPGGEAHGGSTYCAVASLRLMGRLESALTRRQRDRLVRWCIGRLGHGFQGRPNKPDDTCYSFWIGATLTILGCEKLIRFKGHEFVLSTQDPITGGMSKWPEGCTPDPLHTYFGIGGLCLSGRTDDILLVDPALNISERACKHMRDIHESLSQ